MNEQLRRRPVGAPAARSVLLTTLGEHVLPSSGGAWQESLPRGSSRQRAHDLFRKHHAAWNAAAQEHFAALDAAAQWSAGSSPSATAAR